MENLSQSQRYYRENRDAIIKRNLLYYRKNRQKMINNARSYYKRNRVAIIEKIKEYNKIYWSNRRKFTIINDSLKNKLQFYENNNKNKNEIRSYKKLEIIPKEPFKVSVTNNNLLVEI